ncbi:MAG: tetratricopeptide repeat protein [Calothrix sp. SM1_5_4]|nr:tetratricopeptide repeat protein [Calothrix sp. SM1_5_4]
MHYLLALASILVIAAALPASAQQQAAHLEAQLAKEPDNLSVRLQTATLYAREGKHDKVIELLNPYTDQLDSNGFMLLASSYSTVKDHVNEVRVLTILSNGEEENFRWHMLLAQAFLKQAANTKADDKKAQLLTSGIQRLRRVLQLNPMYKPGFDLLLNTLLSQKNNSEAREILLEGLAKFGKRPELLREICKLDANDGFLSQAVKYCRESISVSPDFPDHYVYLIQALNDQREDKAAEKTAVKAAKRFPNSEFVQWATGTLYFKKKNYPVASRYFQAAVKANPKEGRAQIGLAVSLYESGDADKALAHFIEACKFDISSVEKFLAAGAKLRQSGKQSLGEKYSRAANTCR